MAFEDWDGGVVEGELAEMYDEWKAEREKYLSYLDYVDGNDKDVEIDNLQHDKAKLIEALKPFAEIDIDLATKVVLGNAYIQLILNARAILSEVKGE